MSDAALYHEELLDLEEQLHLQLRQLPSLKGATRSDAFAKAQQTLQAATKACQQLRVELRLMDSTTGVQADTLVAQAAEHNTTINRMKKELAALKDGETEADSGSTTRVTLCATAAASGGSKAFRGGASGDAGTSGIHWGEGSPTMYTASKASISEVVMSPMTTLTPHPVTAAAAATATATTTATLLVSSPSPVNKKGTVDAPKSDYFSQDGAAGFSTEPAAAAAGGAVFVWSPKEVTAPDGKEGARAVAAGIQNTQKDALFSLKNTEKLLNETEATGQEAHANLRRQREQMQNATTDLNNMRSELGHARSTLKAFLRRMACDRIIITLVVAIVVCLVVIVVLAVLRARKK